MPLRRNYHTHTHRCKHATGDCADYCRSAVDAGMELLGFADHTPLPSVPEPDWQRVRMAMDQLDDYQAAIETATRDFPGLEVRMGMEVEILPEFRSFYRDELLDRRGFDYLIGSVHYIPVDGSLQQLWVAPGGDRNLRDYCDLAVATIESGLVAYLAHPDLFGVHEDLWTPQCTAISREICACARSHDLPLELNAAGIRKGLKECADGSRRWRYPWRPFWEIAAEEGCAVIIGSDAHHPDEVAHGDDELRGWIEDLGLVERTELPRWTPSGS